MENDKRIINGERVIPTQQFNNKTYYLYDGERYYSKGRKRLHRVVYEYYFGEIPKGFHIHHKNHNSTDNRIENLELVEGKEHLSNHSIGRLTSNKEWFDEFHAKGIEAAKEWHKSPEGIEWHSEHGKKCWENKEYYEKECTVCGKQYSTPFPTRSKFCHNNCKSQANRNRKKLG